MMEIGNLKNEIPISFFLFKNKQKSTIFAQNKVSIIDGKKEHGF